MMQPRLDLIADGKTFEQLCADLLQAEHFVITREPSTDRSGEDLHAREEHWSHDRSRCTTLNWRVQCKHYAAVSKRNFDRREMEDLLVSFQAIAGFGDCLLLMISTEVTEPALEVLEKHIQKHPGSRVEIWNGRHIVAKLDQHPHIASRYGLLDQSHDYLRPFDALADLAPASVAVISDQSALAHDFMQGVRRAGFQVMSLPFWNYEHDYRRSLLLEVAERGVPRLVAVFLGDSFGTPLPSGVSRFVRDVVSKGGAALLFPFLAWLLQRRGAELLRDLCPVTVADARHSVSTEQYWKTVVGNYRSGDFKFLLDADGFAENEYVELRVADAEPPFARDVTPAILGLRHSFEYLKPINGAVAQWRDSTGNPFIVTKQFEHGRVAYVNTCCHECMSLGQMLSPFRSQPACSQVLANVVRWLMSGR